jgi:hypothetical protein
MLQRTRSSLLAGTALLVVLAVSPPFCSNLFLKQIHTAVITNLQPGTRYYYRVGDPTINYWSDPEWSQPPEMNFVTRVENLNSAKIAIFGDMGYL